MDHNNNQQLTPNEHQLLAREPAADKYCRGGMCRDCYVQGWDAAMEYVKEQQRATTELEQPPVSR